MEKRKGITAYCSIWALFLVGLALVCGAVHILSVVSEGFAEGFNGSIGAFFRLVLAKATGWLPFSLGEALIIVLPIVCVILVIQAVRLAQRNQRTVAIRFLVGLLAVITLFYSLFVLTFATAYRGKPLEEKLGLERKKVSAEALEQTAMLLLNRSNELAETAIAFSSDGASDMGYTQRELNDKLNEAYAKATERYSFMQSMNSRVKGVLLSEVLSYAHITGVYTYYTGEANINVRFPDYTVPYTMAHEMAHQRGLAREDEANFVAFLVCMESEDAYIRYSAYLNLYEYVASALSRADRERYKAVVATRSERIVGEQKAYRLFFEPYRENVVADVSNAVNNSYLPTQGQVAGISSYGLVVDLAVAHYLAGGMT